MPRFPRLWAALKFIAPLALLLLLWELLIRSFVRHTGASLGRVAVGTLVAILISVPLGVAIGVSPAISSFRNPLFRFFSVLAGIAWIPIATLWFGYGFGAITFVIFNAEFFVVTYNTLLGVASIPLPLRHAAA